MKNDLKELINSFVDQHNWARKEGASFLSFNVRNTLDLMIRIGCKTAVIENDRLSVTFPDDDESSPVDNSHRHGRIIKGSPDSVSCEGVFDIVIDGVPHATNDKAKTMKDFNLEEAKAGKAVQTTMGLDVRILCFDMDSKDGHPIVALLKNRAKEYVYFYDEAGTSPNEDGGRRLVMKTKIKEVWINLFSNGTDSRVESHKTEDDAIRYAQDETFVKTVRVEWEE